MAAPTITTQPASQSYLVGTNAYFNVVATGTAPLRYQWYKNGGVIGTGTSGTLMLNAVQLTDGGNYSVTVSDSSSAVTSSIVTLTAVAPATTPPALPNVAETTFLVTAYGALGDGATDNTAAIQSALNAAASAGGIVRFPAASKPYLCGPITLSGSTNMQVDYGATLQMLPFYSGTASPTPAGYYPLTGSSYKNFISCSNAHDVEISGPGTIDGQGAPWWTAYTANGSLPHRPYLIDFSGGTRVLVTGVTLSNSPSFHLRVDANNLTVFGLTIMDVNPNNNALNTDGIDPSGTDQLIQNCTVNVFDDNIAVKPESTYCSGITIADCSFGTGHGVSVGGQTNDGLNGMTVTNCTFNGTTTGIRLKADPTEGGVVQNLSYSNLTMTNVTYPIVFYSYYNSIGNPGGSSVTTVRNYNANPPDSLATTTLPVWEDITISNLTATGASGDSILWGLPLASCLIQNVTLNNVNIKGAGQFQIYNASNVQFTGSSSVPGYITCNALAITGQPQSQTVVTGSNVAMSASTVGTSGTFSTPPTCLWSFNGTALADGTYPDGSIVSGARTATIQIQNVQSGEAGNYAVTASNSLDTYNVTSKILAPNSAPVSVTSSTATLTVITPFTAWAISYGLDPAGNGAVDADPDGDGVPNLLVFALGGNPTVAKANILPTGTVTTVAGSPVLVYQFNLNRAAAASVAVTVEYSTDLVNWTTAVDGQDGVSIGMTPVDSATEHITVTIPGGSPRLFARLRVTP
jgi:polygalacturonase